MQTHSSGIGNLASGQRAWLQDISEPSQVLVARLFL